MKFQNKILIVDDSELNRSLLADMLCDEYEILEAENGMQAIKLLEFHQFEISLILLSLIHIWSGELPSLARLSSRSCGAEGKPSLKRAKESEQADPKPGDLPMSRMKLP